MKKLFSVLSLGVLLTASTTFADAAEIDLPLALPDYPNDSQNLFEAMIDAKITPDKDDHLRAMSVLCEQNVPPKGPVCYFVVKANDARTTQNSENAQKIINIFKHLKLKSKESPESGADVYSGLFFIDCSLYTIDAQHPEADRYSCSAQLPH